MPHILVNSDNSVSIAFFPSEINAVEEANKIAASTNCQYVGEYSIPTSQQFRNCWIWNNQQKLIEIDLNKAKEQKLAEIRIERNKLLEASDPLMARANEIGSEEEIKKLKDYRQKLRNLPEDVKNHLNKINSVDDLENLQIASFLSL